MGERLLEAAFVWNWNSLVGSVQGALRALGAEHDAAWVSGTLGEAFRAPAAALLEAEVAFARKGYQPRSLDGVAASLEALGLHVRVEDRDPAERGRPRFLGRRIRRRINDGCPVIAYGAGVADFALIVGYEDRKKRYRVSGPLTEQVGEWLPYDRLPSAGERRLLVLLPERAPPDREAAVRLARGLARTAESIPVLERWRGLLESDAPIDAQGHAYWAAVVTAARNEAARFWRAAGLDGVADASQRTALALSRFTTLFPYPAGGGIDAAGVREVGAAALGAAIAAERDALATLAAERPG